jgi:hypothetical protein
MFLFAEPSSVFVVGILEGLSLPFLSACCIIAAIITIILIDLINIFNTNATNTTSSSSSTSSANSTHVN